MVFTVRRAFTVARYNISSSRVLRDSVAASVRSSRPARKLPLFPTSCPTRPPNPPPPLAVAAAFSSFRRRTRQDHNDQGSKDHPARVTVDETYVRMYGIQVR